MGECSWTKYRQTLTWEVGEEGKKYYYVSNVLFEWPLITYITYVITFIIRYHYCFYDILYRY